MSTSPATIRDRMATAAGAVAGWSETSPFDLFSDRALRHQTFAVGLAETTPDPRARQSGSGILSTTTVQIVSAYHLRIDGRIADFASALEAEAAFVAGIIANFNAAGLPGPLTLVRIQRAILDDQQAAVLTTSTFTVQHYYPL